MLLTGILKLLKLSISNDGQGLDYFINSKINRHSKNLYSKFKKYIVWVIGGTYSQKKISKTNILNICDKISFPIIFIGGKNEFEAGEYIVSNRINGESINYCGKLNFDQSALLIKKSSLVLSNDTGFMHISAAFNKKIISFWGCTKPVLGMFPYVSEKIPLCLLLILTKDHVLSTVVAVDIIRKDV